ncbi:hypothetical protein [Xylella fastidiosa]|uniref:hypothetical protein n=1 Tax=Xylella fastidiosa TaxID=2371 RepID=UPI0012D9F033|nr:hypothetical protein [Xylella fastidiosa]MDG5826242.1 hypothetical protein [Xylella fastidiosa subsp. pauca]
MKKRQHRKWALFALGIQASKPGSRFCCCMGSLPQMYDWCQAHGVTVTVGEEVPASAHQNQYSLCALFQRMKSV